MTWTERAGLFARVAVGAACIVLAFAPWDIWPLAFIGLVPLLDRADDLSDRQLLGWAWLMGWLMNVGGFHWVTGLVRDFGELPVIIGVLTMLLLCAQQALVYGLGFWFARKVERGTGLPLAWSLVPGLVAAEAVIPLVFPWRLGHSQVYHLPFVQSVELGGIMLTTALVVVINAIALTLWRWWRAGDRREPLPRIVAVGAAILLLNHAWGLLRIHQIERDQRAAPTVAIGLAEADISIRDKWDPGLYQRNLLIHQQLSAQLEQQGAELIVWPESAFELETFIYARRSDPQIRRWSTIHRDVSYVPQAATALPASVDEDRVNRVPASERAAPQRGFTTPLLTGTTLLQVLTADESAALPPSRRGPRRYQSYNSSMLLSDDGTVIGIADKSRLMPISEEIPWATALWRATGVNLYTIVPSSGLMGKAEQGTVLTLPREGAEDVRIGVMVCYEDLMPRFARDLQRQGPNVLINLTNDAWFGRDTEPWQHLALAIPRAIEQRTWLIRSTNTGISAFVDATGRVVQRSDPYGAEALLQETALMPARATVFMAVGNWPAWSAIGVVLVGWWRSRRRVAS